MTALPSFKVFGVSKYTYLLFVATLVTILPIVCGPVVLSVSQRTLTSVIPEKIASSVALERGNL